MSAYLIAQLGKNFANHANDLISGQQLFELAMAKIKELQYLAGGMVVFLEAEDNEKLMQFYESQNGFKRLDTKETKTSVESTHTLIQLLKVL